MYRFVQWPLIYNSTINTSYPWRYILAHSYNDKWYTVPGVMHILREAVQ